jgi:hypothetical protein
MHAKRYGATGTPPFCTSREVLESSEWFPVPKHHTAGLVSCGPSCGRSDSLGDERQEPGCERFDARRAWCSTKLTKEAAFFISYLISFDKTEFLDLRETAMMDKKQLIPAAVCLTMSCLSLTSLARSYLIAFTSLVV